MKKSPKIKNGLAYNKISTYFKLDWLFAVGLVVSGIVFDSLMAFVPIVQGTLINEISASSPLRTILQTGTFFILLVAFIQVNRFFKRFFVRIIANRMVYRMRKISYNYLLHSDLGYFSANSKGDILNRTISDIDDATEAVRKIATELFDTFILISGYIIVMFIMDYKLTLISLIFIIASVFVAESVKKLVYTSAKKYKQYLSKSKEITLCSLKNEVYYRSLGISTFYNNKYEKDQDNLENYAIRSLIYGSSLSPIYQMIVWLGLFFAMWMAGGKVMSNEWQIGTFSAYLATYLLVAAKTSSVGKVFNSYQSFKVSWKRCKIYLFLTKDPTVSAEKDKSGLVISNLTFGFEEEKPILKNISFSAKQGEILGVCGRVHTGKSTLLEAINGFYDYKGSIKLNGVEVKDIRKSESLGIIGFCSAYSSIFHDTLENNIAFDCSSPSIDKALYISELTDEVKAMDGKDKQLLTHSLANLSGGQQKRLMIARAVYLEPQLLMLDNPFEAIDEKTSLEILSRIRECLPNSILIYVSNQKNILKVSDRLLYLKPEGSELLTYSELSSKDDFVDYLGGDKK